LLGELAKTIPPVAIAQPLQEQEQAQAQPETTLYTNILTSKNKNISRLPVHIPVLLTGHDLQC